MYEPCLFSLLGYRKSYDFEQHLAINPMISRMEGPAMDWKTEEYPPDEGNGEMAWVWSKGVSLGKKFLVAGLVMSSAPLIVPPLVLVSTIAMISSVPYCLFLTSYACTQKLMSTLLPSSAYDGGAEETRGTDKYEYGFEEDNKHGHVITGTDEAETLMDMDKPSPGEVNPILIQIEDEEVAVADAGEEPAFQVTEVVVAAAYERPGVPENEEMEKETKKLIESIRDEGRTDKVHVRTLEKALQEDEKPIDYSDTKSGKAAATVEDLPDEREGELESTVTGTSTSTSTSKGKDEETIPSEPLDRAVDAPRGTREEKRENSNKKKRKTGRSARGLKVVYDEEQIREKIDAVRKIVGYDAAAKGRTCAEELRALYVFTGVEPPTPMSDEEDDGSVDVAQIGERLRLLMSVIGIK